MNMDLIYGLPYQTLTSFRETVETVISLCPDRIALYSYAHVPWLKPHQKKIPTSALPDAEEKLDIFLMARNLFLERGYQAIAMDHFALPGDSMAKSFNAGVLYRNFMGYTMRPADDFLGLGVSSIGFIAGGFFQNLKKLGAYGKRVKGGGLPVDRGMLLSDDDLCRQWTINQIMCRFQCNKNTFIEKFHVSFDEYFHEEQNHLLLCEKDGLLTQDKGNITVTELGKLFVRNICMGFDAYLKNGSGTGRFSNTV